MQTKSLLLITFFFCGLHLPAQTVKRQAVATPVIKAPVAQKITSPVNKGTVVNFQKATVDIVVGDDGKEKDSKLSITINIPPKSFMCGYYGGPAPYFQPISSGAYSPGENVTIPITLYAGIVNVMDNGTGNPKVTMREALYSDFASGGYMAVEFLGATHDVWKIRSLTLNLFFDNDPVTPYKITWTNIEFSDANALKNFNFDKNFRAVQ